MNTAVGAGNDLKEPPNAPDTVAAEKNKAVRSPYSERLYQLHIN